MIFQTNQEDCVVNSCLMCLNYSPSILPALRWSDNISFQDWPLLVTAAVPHHIALSPRRPSWSPLGHRDLALTKCKGKVRSKSGLEIKIFSREPNCIFISFIKILCISNSTYLGSLQKFEGAAGAFNGALGSWHPLISSPVNCECAINSI